MLENSESFFCVVDEPLPENDPNGSAAGAGTEAELAPQTLLDAPNEANGSAAAGCKRRGGAETVSTLSTCALPRIARATYLGLLGRLPKALKRAKRAVARARLLRRAPRVTRPTSQAQSSHALRKPTSRAKLLLRLGLLEPAKASLRLLRLRLLLHLRPWRRRACEEAEDVGLGVPFGCGSLCRCMCAEVEVKEATARGGRSRCRGGRGSRCRGGSTKGRGGCT